MTISSVVEKWQIILAAILLIIGATITVDTRYAKSTEVAAVQSELDVYKIEQYRDKVQQRIWDTQDRLEQKKDSPELQVELKDRLRDLKDSLDKADVKIKELKYEKK
jgi:hypothetical protein